VAEDVIRARRIELLDAQGSLRLALDGGEQSEDGPPRMILYGPDGRVWIIMCSFDPEGKPLIRVRGGDGEASEGQLNAQ
jgi:hypothetical protein